ARQRLAPARRDVSADTGLRVGWAALAGSDEDLPPALLTGARRTQIRTLFFVRRMVVHTTVVPGTVEVPSRGRRQKGNLAVTLTRRHRPNRSISTAIARARAGQRAAAQQAAAPTTDPQKPIRVVVADDSFLIREALTELLTPMASMDLVGA